MKVIAKAKQDTALSYAPTVVELGRMCMFCSTVTHEKEVLKYPRLMEERALNF